MAVPSCFATKDPLPLLVMTLQDSEREDVQENKDKCVLCEAPMTHREICLSLQSHHLPPGLLRTKEGSETVPFQCPATHLLLKLRDERLELLQREPLLAVLPEEVLHDPPLVHAGHLSGRSHARQKPDAPPVVPASLGLLPEHRHHLGAGRKGEGIRKG